MTYNVGSDVAARRNEMDDIEPISPPNSELDRLRTENAAMRDALDNDHADIKRLRTENIALRAQLAEARFALAAARNPSIAERHRDEFERHRSRGEPRHPPSNDGFINDYD